MAGERLVDACEVAMGQSPPGSSCNTVGIGLPLLNGPTEYGPHHPSPVQFTTDARKRARLGDVLFCVRGSTTGRMNWADREYAIGRGVAAIRHRVDPNLQPFVRAVIEYGLPGLLAQATGSTFPSVSADQLSCLWWPPLEVEEQRAIAHILGTLDDKIELNRRMSETLEAMARALFKSWFVDFLPVRAKMAAKSNDPSLLLPQAEPNTWFVYAVECNNGSLYIGQTEDLRQRWLQHIGGRGGSWTKLHPPVRVPYWEKQPSREAAIEREKWLKTGFGRKWLKIEIAARTQTGDPVRAKSEGRDPGLPQPLADLFPARLVDSELGEIPEGWELAPIADHFDAVKGVSYKGAGLGDDGMPLHNLNSVYEGGGYKYEGIKYYSGEYADRHIVTPGDVIVANTEQGHDRLLIGYAAIVPTFFGARGIASHHIYRLRPKPRSGLTSAFLCQLLNSPQMHDLVSGYANGTTVNMLPIDGVQKPLVVCPPRRLVAAFDSLATTAEHRHEEMVSESRTLAALRDALLPKLISGELRIEDAEGFIGSAV